MRIIRYLKGHIGALVLIIALLVVQAFADLSLPRYTSDLVDVGIQQGGIDRPSPSEFTADTFEAVCMLASPDEEGVIRSSYDEVSDGSYAINKKGLDNRDELDEALAKPFAEAHEAKARNNATAPSRVKMHLSASSVSRMRKARVLTISTPCLTHTGQMPFPRKKSRLSLLRPNRLLRALMTPSSSSRPSRPRRRNTKSWATTWGLCRCRICSRSGRRCSAWRPS